MEKTKFDYEIEAFEKNFSDKKHLKMVIYGTGRMTATLVSLLKGYHIIGLCDRDSNKIGEKIYGVDVVNREFVENNADLVIINTSESYWNTIYQRIKNWKIPIYYRNGELAKDKKFFDENDPYWNTSMDDLKRQIDKYEVISFDVFDTLIMRKVCSPLDIFLMVELKLNINRQEKLNFVEMRKNATAGLINPTYDEIYENLFKISGWNEECVQTAKNMEWELEKQLIVPRYELVTLFKSIRETKEVYFISDMYFTALQIKELLSSVGIEQNDEKILISCDYNKTKAEGGMWNYYKDNILSGRKALHIGDSIKSDVEAANKVGVNTYYVRGPIDMLNNSSLAEIAPYIENVYSSYALGNIFAKVFNNPFGLNDTKGKICFNSLETAGYCLWGNIIYSFFVWLHKEALRENIKKYAFFAREGYLLVPLFEEYCKQKDIDEIELKGQYLEISRRAMFTASIRNYEDICEIADFPYSGTMKDFFKDRFNVQLNKQEIWNVEYAHLKKESGKFSEVLMEHMVDILAEAQCERHNYLQYLNDFELGENCAVVDSQLYGSIQYYLSKLIERQISGYYMCACMDDSNKYKKYNKMYGCYTGRDGMDGKSSSIFKYAMIVESFLTAPNGMFLYINQDGEKVYSEKKNNQKFYDVRWEMFEGIKLFMKDMIDIEKTCGENVEDNDYKVADILFELFMNGGFEPLDNMRHSFFYDNGIAGNKEVPIWE